MIITILYSVRNKSKYNLTFEFCDWDVSKSNFKLEIVSTPYNMVDLWYKNSIDEIMKKVKEFTHKEYYNAVVKELDDFIEIMEERAKKLTEISNDCKKWKAEASS